MSTAPAAGGASRAKRLLWIAPFAIYLALAGTGITWGLPNDHSWSNDDIAPNTVLRVGEFYWGASHKYPYLQLFIDRALYEPYILMAQANGQYEADCRPVRRDCFVDRPRQVGRLILISRLRSLVMGAGVVALVASAAAMLFGPQAAFWAAMLAAVNETLGFFGKQGNLDVPYSFWFMASLLPWLRIMRGAGRRDWLLFGLLAGAALATKESIVGAYVLMGGAMLIALVRQLRRADGRGGSRPSATWEATRRLGLMACGLLGVYGLVMNVALNWSGFVDHLRHWVGGPGVEDFNDAYAGPLWLARMTWNRSMDGAGRPLWLFLAVAPIASLWWPDGRPGGSAARRVTLWLLVPVCSYLLFTILPIRFVYSRFLLPVFLLLAIAGGPLAARLWQGPADLTAPTWGLRRLVGRVALIGMLGYSGLYSLNQGLAMRADTRLAAEAWMAANLPSGAQVVAFGDEAYFPRLDLLDLDPEVIRWKTLPPYLPADDPAADDEPTAQADALAAMMLAMDDAEQTPPPGAPDWLLLSSRGAPPPGTAGDRLQERLQGGSAGYDVVWDSSNAYHDMDRVADRPSPLGPVLWGDFVENRISPRIWVLKRR